MIGFTVGAKKSYFICLSDRFYSTEKTAPIKRAVLKRVDFLFRLRYDYPACELAVGDNRLSWRSEGNVALHFIARKRGG